MFILSKTSGPLIGLRPLGLLSAALALISTTLTCPCYGGDNGNAKLGARLSSCNSGSVPTFSVELPPCNEGEGHLSLSGDVGVPYHLYVFVLDIDVSAGLSGVSFRISYGGQDFHGLRVFDWWSTSLSQFKLPSPDGGQWPQPNSGIILAYDSDPISEVSELDSDGDATVLLGTFYVYAYGTDSFEFSTNDKAADLTCPTEMWQSAIRLCDRDKNETTIVYPDNVSRVTFGQESLGRDPCKGIQSDEHQALIEISPRIDLGISQPNPSRSRVRWRVSSNVERIVEVRIFSVAGRLVRELPEFHLQSGITDIEWDGLDAIGNRVASGTYFVRVTGEDGFSAVRRAVLTN